MLLLIVFLSWPRPPGGFGRGRGMDSLPESRGLAPLQEHLPGVVCHSARGRPVQRRSHGPVCLRHPALRLRPHSSEGALRRRVSGREGSLGKIIAQVLGVQMKEREVTRGKGGWGGERNAGGSCRDFKMDLVVLWM